MADPGTFAAVFAAMFAGHHVGDHIAQTDRMAALKATPGGAGWWAMAGHIVTYHAAVLVALGAVGIVLDLPFSAAGVAVGIAFSAVTHAFLDRRWPVRWILEHTGSPDFAKAMTPICGPYVSDQALHIACLFVSALLVVSVG